MISSTPAATYQSASLYVGDLHPECTEQTLFELFTQIGQVASMRICRDAVTKQSLGYGYVNFTSSENADRAIDTLNFQPILGRPCRIMWSQRDPQLRKSGAGNIYVKNLPPTIDKHDLCDMFSIYGTVLSCKVVQDQEGNSKRYGYIHFENVEDAQKAIAALDGKQLGEEGAEGEGAAKKLHVAMFVARSARSTEDKWTNLFVKQFPEFWTEEDLKTHFEPYGEIASLCLSRDAEGKSMKFAFVNFTDHENAKKCIDELHGKKHELPEGAEVKEGEPTELYVAKHQKKTERERESKIYNDRLRQERIAKFQGMNIYVKNIDDQITDEQFKDLFSKYGTITSARIMKDDQTGVSRGFGFVCYTSPEEASRAINAMNNEIWAGKPITVTLHQKRELRK